MLISRRPHRTTESTRRPRRFIALPVLLSLFVCSSGPPLEAPLVVSIRPQVLACGGDAEVTRITTSTIAPQPHALVLVWIGSSTAEPTNTPSVSGAGMKWDVVQTHIRGGGVRRISVLRAMHSMPTQGNLTIDFGGQEQQAVGWGVVEYIGVDTSGNNGSGAVAQIGVASASGFETRASIDLPPRSQPSNATVGGFLAGTAEGISPGEGFTELFESGAPRRRVMVEFGSSPSGSVEALWPDRAHWIAIALELRSAAHGIGTNPGPTATSPPLSTCQSVEVTRGKGLAEPADRARPPRRKAGVPRGRP